MDPLCSYTMWMNSYHSDFRGMQEYARKLELLDGWTIIGGMIARDPIGIPIIKRPIDRLILP